MQVLKMQDYGLLPLTKSENVETNGGTFPAWLAGALAVSFIQSFGDVRRGLSDGWNGTPNP